MAAASCIPVAWARQVALAESQSAGKFKVAGCAVNSVGIVPCDPRKMRAAVEAQLVSAGLLRPGSLDLDTYSIARNIRSEAGSGSMAERAAIAQSAINRARRDGITISRLTMRDGRYYARQSGRNPRVASAQDPTWSDIVMARLSLSGKLEGVAGGATHYFSPRAQDAMHRRGRTSSDRWDIYDRWARSWGYAWVGPLPGVDPEEQFFMADIGTDDPAWLASYEAGLDALEGRSLPGPDVCPAPDRRGVVFAALGLTSLLGAALWAYHEIKR